MDSNNTVTTLWRSRRPPPPPQIQTFSEWSTPAVPNSAWSAGDFLLGAGMVVIQPETEKILLLYDTERKYWFLPKGRKNIGESLEQAALREAYEESGYRVTFLPLYIYSTAPLPLDAPPDARLLPNSEPIFITTYAWPPRRRDHGGEYLTSYYVGQIPLDAIREDGTCMPDEQNYTSHLLSYNEILERLKGPERRVTQYAWSLWKTSLRIDAEKKAQQSVLDSPRSA